jgi:molybdopterin-synthase adenylyltransferase
MDPDLPALSAAELERYQWQLWTPGYSEAQQQRLKASRVLISRLGGVGGTAALELAAAGIGGLVMAHGGELRLNDLNRQLLMSTDSIGRPRVECIAQRIPELNPHVELEIAASNITAENVSELVSQVDLVLTAAPLFQERLLMNAAAVQQGRPIIHAAMHDMVATVMVTRPGVDACLACLTPEPPSWWTREFPVFGAVAGTAACVAAMEAIKLLTGLGDSLAGKLWTMDFRSGHTRIIQVARNPECPVCS